MGPVAHSLSEHLHAVQSLTPSRYTFIDRVAQVFYDSAPDLLWTFVSSNKDDTLLKQYEVPLSDAPPLAELVRKRPERSSHCLHLCGILCMCPIARAAVMLVQRVFPLAIHQYLCIVRWRCLDGIPAQVQRYSLV